MDRLVNRLPLIIIQKGFIIITAIIVIIISWIEWNKVLMKYQKAKKPLISLINSPKYKVSIFKSTCPVLRDPVKVHKNVAVEHKSKEESYLGKSCRRWTLKKILATWNYCKIWNQDLEFSKLSFNLLWPVNSPTDGVRLRILLSDKAALKDALA